MKKEKIIIYVFILLLLLSTIQLAKLISLEKEVKDLHLAYNTNLTRQVSFPSVERIVSDFSQYDFTFDLLEATSEEEVRRFRLNFTKVPNDPKLELIIKAYKPVAFMKDYYINGDSNPFDQEFDHEISRVELPFNQIDTFTFEVDATLDRSYTYQFEMKAISDKGNELFPLGDYRLNLLSSATFEWGPKLNLHNNTKFYKGSYGIQLTDYANSSPGELNINTYTQDSSGYLFYDWDSGNYKRPSIKAVTVELYYKDKLLAKNTSTEPHKSDNNDPTNKSVVWDLEYAFDIPKEEDDPANHEWDLFWTKVIAEDSEGNEYISDSKRR